MNNAFHVMRWVRVGGGLLPLLLLSTALLSAAEDRPSHVTGFFSNMHFVPESGDVVGMEVWIVYGPGRYYAVIQIGEGAPQIPVVVPVEITNTSVRFRTHEGGPAFSGTATPRGLIGTLGHERVVLPRKQSYWQ